MSKRKTKKPKRITITVEEYEAQRKREYENGLEAGKRIRSEEIRQALGIERCRFSGMAGAPMIPGGWYR